VNNARPLILREHVHPKNELYWKAHEEGYIYLKSPIKESVPETSFYNLIDWVSQYKQVPFSRVFLRLLSPNLHWRYSLNFLFPSTFQSLEFLLPLLEALRLTSLNYNLLAPGSSTPKPLEPVTLKTLFQHARHNLTLEQKRLYIHPPEEEVQLLASDNPIAEGWTLGNQKREENCAFFEFSQQEKILTGQEEIQESFHQRTAFIINGPLAKVDAMSTPLKAHIAGKEHAVRPFILVHQYKHTTAERLKQLHPLLIFFSFPIDPFSNSFPPFPLPQDSLTKKHSITSSKSINSCLIRTSTTRRKRFSPVTTKKSPPS